MATLQDAINTYTTDTATVAADAAAITTAEAAVSAAQAQQATDTTAEQAAASALSSALQTSGPVATVSDDGLSVTVYSYTAAAAPYFSTTVIPTAGAVTLPSGSGS